MRIAEAQPMHRIAISNRAQNQTSALIQNVLEIPFIAAPKPISLA